MRRKFQMPILMNRPKVPGSRWARSKSCFAVFFIFYFSFIVFHSCGLDIEDPTPPSPPVWVQKSLPEEWPERGIDAHESGGIYLEWYSSTTEDIRAYNIYRAILYDALDSLGDYKLLIRLETEPFVSADYIDDQISKRVKYSYSLKAEDVSGNMSEHSDSLTYMVMPSITLSVMRPNGNSIALGPEKRLSWSYILGVEMEDYCITLLTQNNQFLYRENFQPGNYVGRYEYWDIPAEVELAPGQIYKWRVDAGANYHDGMEMTGFESPWASFLFAGE
jgi:hypothetical protein